MKKIKTLIFLILVCILENIYPATFKITFTPIIPNIKPLISPSNFSTGLKTVGATQYLTISWSPVNFYSDGSTATVQSYKIYSSDDFKTEKSKWKLVLTTTTTSVSIPINQKYFKVVSVDANMYESDFESVPAISSNEILIQYKKSQNTDLGVVIPKQLQSIFSNKIISITTAPKENSDIDVYDIELKNISDLKNNVNPNFEGYLDLEFYYKTEDGKVKGTNIDANNADKNLAIFYNNGYKWLKLGGEIDKDSQKVVIKTDHFSKYSLRVSLRSDSFEFTPNLKVFTPKGQDARFQKFVITCINPKNSFISGKIFDIQGRFIRNMESSNSQLQWDGHDEDNIFVETGVYIWQLEIVGENKIINGTVVVVR